MRKILLFILAMSVLFVVGCGSGGGQSTVQDTSPGTSPGTSPSGTGIVISIPPETHATGIHATAVMPYTSNFARVVAIKSSATGAPCYEYDGSTDSYIQISPTGCSAILSTTFSPPCSLTGGAGTCSIMVTPTTGDQSYEIDVLTYYADTTSNIVTRYATGNGFTVSQGNTTTASIAWQVLTGLNLPTPMEKNGKYSLEPIYTPPLFAGASFVRYSASAITDTFPYPTLPLSPGVTITSKFVAPGTATTYLQGLFFIDPRFLQAGESWHNWVYYDNTNASSALTLSNPTQFNIVVPTSTM